MKISVKSAILTIILSSPAVSATIDLDTLVVLKSLTETASENESGIYESDDEGELQYISVAASQSTEDVDGHAGSGVDLTLGASRARVHVEKAPASGETDASVRATTTVSETYYASGDGKAFAAFTVYGDILSTTDLDHPGQFLEAFGAMGINHRGDVYLTNFSTQHSGDTYYLLENGSFNRKLVIEFDVLDGDTFDINSQIRAEVLFDDFQSGGLLFDVDVKSGLRVYGSDGATITSFDPSVVPLPASVLLLLTPVAGLVTLRGRKSKLTYFLISKHAMNGICGRAPSTDVERGEARPVYEPVDAVVTQTASEGSFEIARTAAASNVRLSWRLP